MENQYSIVPPRTDLEKSDFENLLYQKGREVIHEKAIVCPCKSENTNHLSNCKNCGGCGWVFINPQKVRMVITNVSITNEYKPWSEEARGVINVTSQVRDMVSFMDKITLVDADSIHSEVLVFNLVDDIYIAYSAYPIKKVLVSCMFISEEQGLIDIPFSSLTVGPRNKVVLDSSVLPLPFEQVMISVRYYFSPSYCIIEQKRETMQSFKYVEGNEVNQSFPVSSLARRTHYELKPLLNVTIDNQLEENNNSCRNDCTY